MPLGVARAVMTSASVGDPDYSSYGTIIYEDRDAAGLSIPFDTSVANVASGTIAVVFEITTVASGNQYCAGSGATSSSVAGVAALSLTDGSLRARASDGTTVLQQQIGVGAITDGAPVVGLMTWQDGGNLEVRVGGSENSTSIAALGSLGTANFFGGSTNPSGTNPMTGAVYHLIVFSTVVADLAALETALNADWGIT